MTSPALRAPANRASPRAVSYWRLAAILQAVLVLVPVTAAYVIFSPHPWWGTALLVLLALLLLARVVVVPGFRYRIHRWEVTDTAVFTRSGWLTIEERIAPLSRVQTVDSHQTATMRPFGLATITVTTASSAGPVRIECLDHDVAKRVVAELTEVTGASEGDAT